MRSLFAEYVAETPELMAFFERPAKALFSAPAKARPWNPELVEVLREYQERLGGRALFMGDEALVVTGQQPGIFTGPLYTIYKAATAVILAQKLQARSGVPHVPLFWLGSDDHDFEEAAVVHLLTKNHDVLALKYTPAVSTDGLPLYRVAVEHSLHDLVELAAQQAPGSEFREEIARFLHESLDGSESLADWCARLLSRLFRDTPLVVFSSHLREARALATPIMRKEIDVPLASTRLLNEAGAALFSLGFPQQIEKADFECNFFLEVSGKRRKVVFQENTYCLPETDARYTTDEMLGKLRDAPEAFSPNVALRCIVQQHLFPCSAYVAGPAELAYWAQLKPMFQYFDVKMPVVYPRAHAVLIPAKVNQLMERLGMARKDLAAPQDEILQRALQAAGRDPALEVVQQRRVRIEAAMQELAANLAAHDRTAADMAQKLAERTIGELDRIERSILKGDEARSQAARKQVERLYNTLLPNRKPQERVYTIFSFLFEHGWDLIRRLLKDLDIESFRMNEVEL